MQDFEAWLADPDRDAARRPAPAEEPERLTRDAGMRYVPDIGPVEDLALSILERGPDLERSAEALRAAGSLAEPPDIRAVLRRLKG